MHPVVRLVTVLCCIALAVAGSGCFKTTLPALPPPPGSLERLLQTADQTLALDVGGAALGTVGGHQYLLFFVPMTRIIAPSLGNAVAQKVALEAATRGIRLVATAEQTAARMSVDVAEWSASGYDFFFIRRPSASVTLTATLVGSRTRHCTAQGESHSYRATAFETQLNRELERALETAAQKLFDCLLPTS